MEEIPGHVLKSNDVKVEGHFRLDVDAGVGMRAKAGTAMLTEPQVLVTETHAEFAVIEVTCRCGGKTHIRCEYAPAPSTEPKPDQKNDGETDNAS